MTKLPQISAVEWYREQTGDGPTFMIDVRAPKDAAAWPVPVDGVQVIQGSRLLDEEQAALAKLPRSGEPITVICARGISSVKVVDKLADLGYNARSVAGGMAAVSRVLVPRRVNVGPGATVLQFDRVGKGCLSYMVIRDGQAVVIDPTVDPEHFLDDAAEAGVHIVAVVDTHLHADHVSVGPELASAAGATYLKRHTEDSARSSLEEGQLLPTGLRVLVTPGHTADSVALVLDQQAVFTGDTLFVSGVGRPDLGGKAHDWAPLLYESLRHLHSNVAQGALVLPSHYSHRGESNGDGTFGRPLGDIVRDNSLLGLTQKAFVDRVLNGMPNEPDNYETIREINAGERTATKDKVSELETGPNRCATGH